MIALPMSAALDGNAPAGTYLCDPDTCTEIGNDPYEPTRWARTGRPGHGHCWHESTRRRLEWQGGPSVGAAADLAAWNRLGASQ